MSSVGRLYSVIYIFLFCACFGLNLNAQKIEPNNIGTNLSESDWKGFLRLDFEHAGRKARLIVPEKALPGNPWIWRARFPDWHTDADSILVSEGYHLAYINTNDLFGSDRALDAWDQFYGFLTATYQLKNKVALMGVSRGGLFVYNWAKRNPKRVTCIYAEAPVCDFKSWPAGFGSSKGSEQDWARFKAEYGFDSDEEARSFGNIPLNELERLADEGIPILHMIGLDDEIVPIDENTMPLINQYIKLGGSATVVPCTQGKQTLQGHHFDIQTPRLVADFVKYHSGQ